MFPEKRKDGSWIRKIVFNFPVPVDGEEVKELPLETETTVETVVTMSRKKPDDTIEVDLDLDELDITSAESKATYQEIKDYVLKEFGLKVSTLCISQIKRKCGIDVGEHYNISQKENLKYRNVRKKRKMLSELLLNILR